MQPMPTKAKTEKIEELAEKLGRAQVAILVQTQGLTVKEQSEMRGKMRAAKLELQVAKNTLLRIASERNNMTELDKSIFNGQTTVAFGYEDEVAAAKAVTDYLKTSKVAVLKSGIMGGRSLTAAQVEDLGKIVGGKDTVKGQLVGTLQAPLSNLYSVLTAPMRDLCYVLQARAEQLNSGESAAE